MACISKRRNRYVIDFYDTQGIRRRKALPEGSTKEKARTALRNLEDQLLRGTFIPEKHVLSLSEVAKEWLKHKKPNLRESSYGTMEGHTRNHFEELSDLKINRITTAHIEKWIGKRQKDKMHILTIT